MTIRLHRIAGMVIAVALAGAALPARGAQPPDLNKVMRMYDDLYRADSSSAWR